MFNPAVTMTLGNITFVGREIPAEFGDLGGRKELIVTEFPGGQIAAQYMGSFPEPKTWTGELFGADVQIRAQQLNQLWQTSDAVTLQAGQWNFYGAVEKFVIIQQQQNWIKYTCTFRVFQDNSQGNTGGGANPATDATSQTQANISKLNNLIAGYGTGLPAGVASGTTTLTSNLQSAVQSAGNSVASLSTSQVNSFQSQISNLQSQLSSSLSSTDSGTASLAYSANTALQNLSNSLSSGSSALDQITIEDPVLPDLASEYYGDPGLWTLIADENADENGALDSDLTGVYTLTIPKAPTVTSSDELMWEQGAA